MRHFHGLDGGLLGGLGYHPGSGLIRQRGQRQDQGQSQGVYDSTPDATMRHSMDSPENRNGVSAKHADRR